MKKLLSKYALLFYLGGSIYYFMEVVWRDGYSYLASFLMGGTVFVFLGLLNETFKWEAPLVVQMLIGTVGITLIEFITGVVVNIWLGLNQWDYSNYPLNILGQICVPYMGLWFLLSLVGIVLDDYLRYWFFNEEKPRYKLF